MTTPWLAIIGIGEDGHLPPLARAALNRATLIFGGARHLALAQPRAEQHPWPTPMASAYPAILARRGQPTAILASGDPFCFGVGASLAALVPMAEITCHPAPSAFTLARARLGWSVTTDLSACGRPLAAIVPHLQPGARLLILSADATTPAATARLLHDHGLGASTLTILEAMGGPHERTRQASAATFDVPDIHSLNTIAVAVAGHAAHHLAPGLPDALYAHDGQLTRREMRAITLSTLAPRQGQLLWDVGGGAGSIAIEWMLRHPANRAIAVEQHPLRAARIAENALARGTPALRVVEGTAPAALTGLPQPDAVFLGGGAHEPGVIDTAWAALPEGGLLVANAVTLETETALAAARTRLGGTFLRVGLERLDAVGTMHAFRPAMTVTQWAVTKRGTK